LKKAKAEITTLKKVLTSQRDRMDRLFAEDVVWPLEEVETYYVGHDLLCKIAGHLIWDIEVDSKRTGAIWHDGAWWDVTGTEPAPNAGPPSAGLLGL